MSVLDAGLRRLYQRLAETGLPIMVGGSVAAMWYGEPRSTLDIDVILRAGPSDADRLASAFPEAEFYVPPAEAIRRELGRAREGQFNVIDLTSGLKADIYVAGDDPLIAYGFAHTRQEEVAGLTLNLAPATYVVAIKLRFYGLSQQDKHLRDVRSLLATSPELVDMERVAAWAKDYGVEEAWEACQTRSGEE